MTQYIIAGNTINCTPMLYLFIYLFILLFIDSFIYTFNSFNSTNYSWKGAHFLLCGSYMYEA